MLKTDLHFEYPQNLVATEPQWPSRVLFVPNFKAKSEISLSELMNKINPGDLIVINDTKVEPRRVHGVSESGKPIEVLFLQQTQNPQNWKVLLPLSRLKRSEKVILPGSILLQIVEGGRPQTVTTNESIDSDYFFKHGEMPLPPYIQQARNDRHSNTQDKSWYQTQWASKTGSSAAPTASLHFRNQDWTALKAKGVRVEALTLHVGLGTYLPLTSDKLSNHQMHSEEFEISAELIDLIKMTKSNQKKIWALGTTVTRALESWAIWEKLQKGEGLDLSLTESKFESSEIVRNPNGGIRGKTSLLIAPGYDFKVVDFLMTNFHQPESTLLALVMAFAGKNTVLDAYQFAIHQGFRLFSYGDLSVWQRQGNSL